MAEMVTAGGKILSLGGDAPARTQVQAHSPHKRARRVLFLLLLSWAWRAWYCVCVPGLFMALLRLPIQWHGCQSSPAPKLTRHCKPLFLLTSLSLLLTDCNGHQTICASFQQPAKNASNLQPTHQPNTTVSLLSCASFLLLSFSPSSLTPDSFRSCAQSTITTIKSSNPAASNQGCSCWPFQFIHHSSPPPNLSSQGLFTFCSLV